MTYSDPLTKTEETPRTDPVISETSVSPNAAGYADIMGLLKVEHPSGKEQSMLERINEYLKGKSPVDRLMTIRHLENRLGTPKIGETRLGNVYNYIKVSGQIKELEGVRDTMLA